MQGTTFDGLVRTASAPSTRRGLVRMLGGAAALGAVAAVGHALPGDAKSKGKKITVCFQYQTRTVKKKGYQDKYPGATSGACAQQPVCTSWILSGGPAVTAQIAVDDDLAITVNGASILKDENKMASTLPPVTFAAQPGDSLAVTAIDSNPACRSLSPLWLHCATTGQKKQLSAGNSDGCAPGRTAGQFFSQVFTIGV